jgi:hypothetical protein
LSLDALFLLAQGITKGKVDWFQGIIMAIFGKPSQKQSIADTLNKLGGLKAQGLLVDE